MKAFIARLATADFWRDALERAFANAWQLVLGLGILIPGVDLASIDWLFLIGVAASAALASILMSIVTLPDPNDAIPKWQAILWRAVRTYLSALAVMLTTDVVNVFDLDWQQTLLAPLVPVLLAIVKNAVTTPVETIPKLRASIS
jgi:hypothetical protein